MMSRIEKLLLPILTPPGIRMPDLEAARHPGWVNFLIDPRVNYVIAGWVNFVIVPWVNFLTFSRLRRVNYLIADKDSVFCTYSLYGLPVDMQGWSFISMPAYCHPGI